MIKPCTPGRRLYAMGVITTKKSLVQLEKLSTAAFCRRRLAVVMVRLKMSETLREAATFIEQVRYSLLMYQATPVGRSGPGIRAGDTSDIPYTCWTRAKALSSIKANAVPHHLLIVTRGE